ncbi:hypothetical protein GGI20_000265 [Coemansia sp. BCRC 34301]|nr:hypothetical protein GGI20_000265 [Coemansia sp. BCRC 34301]
MQLPSPEAGPLVDENCDYSGGSLRHFDYEVLFPDQESVYRLATPRTPAIRAISSELACFQVHRNPYGMSRLAKLLDIKFFHESAERDYDYKQMAAGLLKPEDCRLVLLILRADDEDENEDDDMTYPLSASHVGGNYNDYALCAMFPPDHSVECQAMPAPHLVADTEINGYGDFHENDMDLSCAGGRRAFISLFVDWSLCSVDCLGFDPSIRYAFDSETDRPYIEIDVYERGASCTYYSNRCAMATDGLTGCHTRHFAASASVETINDPTVLIKDMWLPLSNGHSGDMHNESSALDVLHSALDRDSEFGDKFP